MVQNFETSHNKSFEAKTTFSLLGILEGETTTKFKREVQQQQQSLKAAIPHLLILL